MSNSNRVDVKNIIILGILLSIIVLLGIWSFTEQKAESYQIQEMKDKGKVPSRLDAPVEMKQIEQKNTKEDAMVEIAIEVTPEVKVVIENYISELVSQIGITQNSDGTIKYGEWWASKMSDNTQAKLPWSTMFLAWSAAQVGIAQETIGYFGTCTNMKDYYEGKGWFYITKVYKPSIGDIIFVDTDADDTIDRVGVVENVSDNEIVAIMGDMDGAVKRKTYDRSNKNIKGYGKPDYANNEKNVNKQNEQIQMASMPSNSSYGSTYNVLDDSTYNSAYNLSSDETNNLSYEEYNDTVYNSTYSNLYDYSDEIDTRTGYASDTQYENYETGNRVGAQSSGTYNGSSKRKIIKIAEAEIGYTEESDGWSKYGQWYEEQIIYSTGYAKTNWSAMFVSWCAYQAGIPNNVIKPFATPTEGIVEAKKMGMWHDNESYTPKVGDIIFFVDGSHCGLVIDYVDGLVYTIEGDTNRKVNKMCHEVDEFPIEGYASPNY